MINTINRVFVKYDDARALINEADLLLFRGQSLFARIIKFGSSGMYSHIGMASWSNGGKKHKTSVLEILEFKAQGGVSTNLDLQISENSGTIDVYRAVPEKISLKYNPITQKIEEKVIKLQPKLITKEMRRMSGLPYGFKRLLWLLEHKLFGFFMNLEPTSDDDDISKVYPICSSAVSYCFSKYGYDLVKNRADEWTEPSDIARSPLIQYLFTIKS